MGVGDQFLIDRALKKSRIQLAQARCCSGLTTFINWATFMGLATSIHFDRNDIRQGSLWKLQNRSCCNGNRVGQAAWAIKS